MKEPPRPKRLSLVVQKEVAERWVAAGGGSLSTVAVRVFAQAELVMVLPARAFQPVPRVDSALVLMHVRDEPAVKVSDLGAFFAFVEQVFQFRRKQLRSSLGRLTGEGSAAAEQRLRALGVDPARRPETLDLAEWQRLYEAFST